MANIATLSIDFLDAWRAPQIERAVIEMESRIRSAHPEVTALFVKPQSSLSAPDRLQQGGQGRMLSDPLFEEENPPRGHSPRGDSSRRRMSGS